MNNLKITLVVGKDEVILGEGFRFSDKLNSENQLLYCAEFDPPLKVDAKFICHLNFADFTFSLLRLRFSVDKLSDFIYKVTKPLKIKIVTPVPVPQSLILNANLLGPEDTVLAHLFFIPGAKRSISDVEYWMSIGCEWHSLTDVIKANLIKDAKGVYGISLGILEISGEIPSLMPMKSFLFPKKKTLKKGKKIIAVVVNSFVNLTFQIGDKFVSIDNLPKIPKDLIYRIRSSTNDPFTTIERRAIKVCLNGGIPVHFLDSGLKIKYQDDTLKTEDFDRIELSLETSNQIANEILQKLEIYIENAKDHLSSCSSEASYRALFWDPVLNRMFQNGLESQPKLYRIEPELKTSSLLPDHQTQFIDYTAGIQLNEQEFPVLLVEIGKEPFDLDNAHKDHSKLLNLMTQTCLKLAQAFVAKNKLPEVIRVGGLWIGGLTAQFVIAHPVVTKLAENDYSIHIHLSTDPTWFYDLASTGTDDLSTSFGNDPAVFEFFIRGTLKLEEYICTKAVDLPEVSLDKPVVVPTTSVADSNSDLDPSSAADSKVDPEPIPKEVKVSFINPDGLLATNFFIQYIKSRIDLIHAEYKNGSRDDRKFHFGDFSGVLVESRRSSNLVTPDKSKVFEAGTRTTASASTSSGSKKSKTIIVQKNSLKELDILLKLTNLSNIFPIIYEFEIISAKINEEAVNFEIEEMEPVFDIYSQTLSSEILCDHPVDTLYYCLNFTLQILFSLHTLHESFNIIHSDISINNIMYSTISKSWKLIDYNHSLEINESIKTKRIAGTRGFIAPESLNSGIFTMESDVYSLGRVLVVLFDFLILGEICVCEDENLVSKEEIEIGNEFLKIIAKMVQTEPSQRPKTLESIEEVFNILINCVDFKNSPIYRHVSLLLQKQESELENLVKQLKSAKIDLEVSQEQPENIPESLQTSPKDLFEVGSSKRSKTSTLEQER